MRISSLVIVVTMLAAVSAASPLRAAEQTPDKADQQPLKIFVLAGTSNMLGANAKPEDLPEELRGPLANVLVNRGGAWVPLEAGKSLVGNEAVFGEAMAKHLKEPVGIVWISVRYAASNSPGPGLQNMVKQAREKGRPIEIVGMLLDVSFGDGLKEETAKAYGRDITRWIETVRRDLGNEKLPIVLMRGIPPLPSTPHLQIVRDAQDALKLPNVRVISGDEAARGGDKVHFNTAGRLEMGKRYAAAMIELLPMASSD